MLEKRRRAKMQSFELKFGLTTIKLFVPYAYGDRFNIKAETSNGTITSIYRLSNSENKENSKRLSKLIKYIQQNSTAFQFPYEITPKMYNVVVITE